MPKVKKVNIVQILKEAREREAQPEFFEYDEVEKTEVAEIVPEEESQIDVKINDSVEAIELKEIRDEYGRISDLIESLEQETGMSVIPMEIGHIANEVIQLKRYKIYEYLGQRVAMSHTIRENVIEGFKERIKKTLTMGLPFKESLSVTINYKDVQYETLALSEDEWTLLMTMFRNYKERLVKGSDGKFTLEILPDRV